MSLIRNRELSQFGSFIYIDDNSQTIGITTESEPNVGIGTKLANSKLEVFGNTIINGNLEASSFTLNGVSLIDASIEYWETDNNGDIYRLSNVGIGTTLISEKLTVDGNVSASSFISTATSPDAPFTVTSQTLVTNLNADYLRGGIPGSNINVFDIVTNGAEQTLTDKTLISPNINSPIFDYEGVTFEGETSGSVVVKASNTTSGILTLPSGGGVLATLDDVRNISSDFILDETITNSDIAPFAGILYSKLNLTNSIVGSDINSSAGIQYSKLNLTNSIKNSDIAVGAAISVSKLSASTISGVSLGSTLSSLTAGSYINFGDGTTYNGSTARTVSVAATTANTANSLVARSPSGDFTAGTVSVTNLTANTTVSANQMRVETSEGIVLTSPNGTKYILTVNDFGTLVVTEEP